MILHFQFLLRKINFDNGKTFVFETFIERLQKTNETWYRDIGMDFSELLKTHFYKKNISGAE